MKKKAKVWFPAPPPPRLKKNPTKKKEKPAPKKLANKMIDEELQASVRKQVTDYLAPKKLELKHPMDPIGKIFFLRIMCQPTNKEPLSDYTTALSQNLMMRRRVTVITTKFPSSENNLTNR